MNSIIPNGICSFGVLEMVAHRCSLRKRYGNITVYYFNAQCSAKVFLSFFQHVVSGKITVWFTIVWHNFPSSTLPLAPPKVQVYTRDPGEYGKENTLICRLSKFHPPDVTVQILKNGAVIPNAQQSDLAFGQDWHFHLSKHVSFTPLKGEEYTCRVTHGHTQKDYSWGKLGISMCWTFS